jgi:hypothetical protein
MNFGMIKKISSESKDESRRLNLAGQSTKLYYESSEVIQWIYVRLNGPVYNGQNSILFLGEEPYFNMDNGCKILCNL